MINACKRADLLKTQTVFEHKGARATGHKVLEKDLCHGDGDSSSARSEITCVRRFRNSVIDQKSSHRDSFAFLLAFVFAAAMSAAGAVSPVDLSAFDRFIESNAAEQVRPLLLYLFSVLTRRAVL